MKKKILLLTTGGTIASMPGGELKLTMGQRPNKALFA